MQLSKILITVVFVFNMSLHLHAQWSYNGSSIYYNGGNVGIGTSSPTHPLTINSSGTAWDSYGKVKYPMIMPNASNQVGGGIAVSDDGGFFDWNDSYITYEPLCCNGGLRINANLIVNSNVGIGTTNPQAKLAVNGDIFSKKVKVTQSGWPDFVFKTTYRLRPLSEVEQYIQQYHHLPEIPSAEEVEKNGLDLGQNQTALLQKIEELTLYIIQLNKEIEALKQEIRLPQKKN